MIIVVDGYNVLKLVHGPEADQTHRSAFVNLLGRYIKKRNHKVVVVFDAGPVIRVTQEKHRGVTVIFSGETKTADDVIVEYVEDNNKKEIVVVTADRKLVDQVTNWGAQIIGPALFYQKVRDLCMSYSSAELKAREKLEKNSKNNIIKFDDEDPDFSQQLAALLGIGTGVQDELDDLMYEAARMNSGKKEEESAAGSMSAGMSKTGRVKRDELSKKEKARLSLLDKL